MHLQHSGFHGVHPTMTLRLPIRIGTRGSPLALVQAEQTAARLRAAHGLPADAVMIVPIKTTGDRIQDRTLRDAGGKGLFTKEIEEALLDGSIDVAVHSMKDVETRLPDGLVIDCLLPRADVRDAFISSKAPSLSALPAGAVVGTASLRRQAQVLRLRPDVSVVPLRGNVQTRLAKLAAGEVDATLLAMAGLERLGQTAVATAPISVGDMLPAVAQGAIGVQRRADDAAMAAALAPLHDAATGATVTAERAMLAGLDGSCRTPIAGHAVLLPRAQLRLTGQILSLDGRAAHDATTTGAASFAEALGYALAEELLTAAGPGFLAGH
jgi:hydroxymethylbilane synthase